MQQHQTRPLVDQVAELIAESMGRQTGELFHKFYELEDEADILASAQSLLEEFIGPEMTRKKLAKLRRQS